MTIELALLIVAFLTLLLLDVPIAFAIGIATALALLPLPEVSPGLVVAQRMTRGIESFSLLAIPFFILAGLLMGEGGLARRLIDFANALVGWLPGGLAYVNTLTCMLFGSISGSATAAVSSVGSALIPEMSRSGYSRPFAVALTVTAATVGLIIPPSNIMIVYAVVAQRVSIEALFVAGILPGITIGLLIMAACALLSFKHKYRSSQRTSPRLILTTGLHAFPPLLLIVIVLGGILRGLFTATEASAIAVAYSLLLGFVYREIGLRDLPRILHRAAVTTAVVMLLIGVSAAMSYFLSYQQLPQRLASALLGLSDNPILILLIINITLLLVGTVLDMTPAVLIFTPIFLPVALGLGLHPVHFGVLMIANLCIGLCTPPVGTCLFVGCTVGDTRIADTLRPMLPMFAAMLLGLALITYWPALSLWLPAALGIL